ncbi:MAG: hypothetical protein ACK5EA_28065, partial [Planctomycetaceae bacterium]
AATSSNNARSPEDINSPGHGIHEGLLGAEMTGTCVVTDLRKFTTGISNLPFKFIPLDSTVRP